MFDSAILRKPFVKRGKTDAADAEAICEAVMRRLATIPGVAAIIAASIKALVAHKSASFLISPSHRGLHQGQRSKAALKGRTYDRTVPTW
jgi:transposase